MMELQNTTVSTGLMNSLTLKSKFSLVIAAVFTIATIALLVTLSEITDGIINSFATSVAIKQAQNDTYKILTIIDREVVLAQKMADDALLIQWFKSGDDPAFRYPALEQLESYRKLFRDRSYFATQDSTLRYYVANNKTVPEVVVLNPENKGDQWYFDSIKSVDNFALNLDYNAAIQKVKVWINVIMKDRDGRKLGIVGTGIELTDFLSKIVSRHENGISTILIDKNGVIQAHADKALVEKNALERDNSKKSTIYSLLHDNTGSERLRKSLHSLSSSTETVVAFPLEYAGKKSVAAVSFMPEIGWFTVVMVDVSQVLKFNDFLPIMIVSILALLAVIVVIGIQMNRMVLAPLNLLTTASEQMVAGNYSVCLPIEQHDEIGTLTKSFTTMANTVRDHTENLEESVRTRTIELTQANLHLEQSKARIQESIEYARVIQNSILPADALFDSLFSQWFVIYQPCDIVSGDLYWVRQSHGRTLLAILDCTGHGVPGGFMTMAVNSVLHQLVETLPADNPAGILKELNIRLQQTLNLREGGGTSVDAGLEIALCSIDFVQQSMLFASAGLSLYVVTSGKLNEFKGDRQRVGYRASNVHHNYSTICIPVNRQSTFYAVTDGFFDEGGSEKGYCYGNERFNSLLLENADLPLSTQGALFEKSITEWRGNRKQRDDITMVGFRI